MGLEKVVKLVAARQAKAKEKATKVEKEKVKVKLRTKVRAKERANIKIKAKVKATGSKETGNRATGSKATHGIDKPKAKEIQNNAKSLKNRPTFEAQPRTANQTPYPAGTM